MSAVRPTIAMPIDAAGSTVTCTRSPLRNELDLRIYAAAAIAVVLAVTVLALGGWL